MEKSQKCFWISEPPSKPVIEITPSYNPAKNGGQFRAVCSSKPAGIPQAKLIWAWELNSARIAKARTSDEWQREHEVTFDAIKPEEVRDLCKESICDPSEVRSELLLSQITDIKHGATLRCKAINTPSLPEKVESTRVQINCKFGSSRHAYFLLLCL
ncbi:hypothetical protein Ciccas_009173 [Cichlidogyrus casuarinus]|uniref:Ig-like domain-containing protein n=1 Tax=Cichlidogyrus casuarinus TaxID=1844966 RepID=A0ABD2PXU3_9PLAT